MIENNLNGSVGVYSNIDGISPNLVRYKQNVPSSIDIPKQRWKGHFWSKKQSRMYFLIKSGLRKAEINNFRVRFMSLSSPSPFAIMDYNNFDGYAYELKVTKDLQVLRKRIFREYGFLITYVRLRTGEGEGELHILYFVDGAKDFNVGFINKIWLRENWEEIHGAWNINIQDVSGKKEDVARYFVNQYLVNQSGFVRTSKSDDWIFKGCVREWNYIKSVFLSSKGIGFCLSIWDKWLMYKIKPDVRDIEKDIIKKRLALVCKYSSSGVDYDLLNPILPNWWFVDILGKDILCPADKEYFKGVFAFKNRMWFLGQGGDV